jgi:RNA polymerase sigma factor (sigma-70 family)
MEVNNKKTSYNTDIDEEIRILLIGNENEQNQAIYLIDKYLRKAVFYEIRKSALSISPDDLLDVYQEVMLNMCQVAREKRFDSDKSLLPFVFTIARRRAYDRVRKNTAKKENEEKLLNEISQSLQGTEVGEAWKVVAQKNDGQRMLKVIQQTIVSMPFRQRQVAEIIYERLPEKVGVQEIQNEIQQKTGEPVTAVSVKRAMQEVRKKIYKQLVMEDKRNGIF